VAFGIHRLPRAEQAARVAEVLAIVRRPPRVPLPTGVRVVQADLAAKAADGDDALRLPPIDLACCALGTTIAQAGSQAAFRAVDLDAVLAFARAARAAGATGFGLVSAAGADARSPVFYNRTKGEAEQALIAQGWPRLVIARPSLLLGDRDALAQAPRRAERWAQALMPGLGRLLPAGLRPIPAERVARALVATLLREGGAGTEWLANDALLRLGDPAAPGPASHRRA